MSDRFSRKNRAAERAIWIDEQFELVLDEIRRGATVTAALATVYDYNDGDDPHHKKRFFEHVKRDPGRTARYQSAVEAQCEWMAEDILAIADSTEIPTADKDVRIRARQWLLAKRYAKKYGPKSEVAHTGAGVLLVEMVGGMSAKSIFEGDAVPEPDDSADEDD